MISLEHSGIRMKQKKDAVHQSSVHKSDSLMNTEQNREKLQMKDVRFFLKMAVGFREIIDVFDVDERKNGTDYSALQFR